MKNKVTIGFIILFLGVVIANIGTQCAEAKNYKDAKYYFDYAGDGCDVATIARKKEDASSAYAKNTSTHCTHRITVAGTHHLSGNTPLSYNNCNCVEGGYMVPVGEYRYMTNMVNEWGYEYAFLVIMPTSHAPCTVQGLWSPDSI